MRTANARSPSVERRSPVSDVLDYSRSFVTFFTRPDPGGNIARIQIDAKCTVEGWGADGGPETFYLIAPCRSERMYVEGGPLFQIPNYEFCGVFTADQVSLIRTHWTTDREQSDIQVIANRFDRVAIDLTPLAAAFLPTDPEIVATTLANRPLVAKTTIHDEATGATARLEYPIKTMNVARDPDRFQVDTGPLIVPRFDGDGPPIGRFDIAHVVYWTRDKAEFVLRRPHQVGERDGAPIEVTDYTAISIVEAENEIWGATS